MWRRFSGLAVSLLALPLLAAAAHVIGSPRVGWLIDDQRQVVWVSIGTTLYHCNNLNGASFVRVSKIIQQALPHMPSAAALAELERNLQDVVPTICDRMGGRG